MTFLITSVYFVFYNMGMIPGQKTLPLFGFFYVICGGPLWLEIQNMVFTVIFRRVVMTVIHVSTCGDYRLIVSGGKKWAMCMFPRGLARDVELQLFLPVTSGELINRQSENERPS